MPKTCLIFNTNPAFYVRINTFWLHMFKFDLKTKLVEAIRSNTFGTVFPSSSLPPELNLHQDYFFRKNRLKIDKTSCIPTNSHCTLSEANSVPNIFFICYLQEKKYIITPVTYSTGSSLQIIQPSHGTVTGLIVLNLQKTCMLFYKKTPGRFKR